ncbi:hypothetical protein ACZ90_65040 [Streptomyces albus subsp. albus]|nr:hypothetical protein ACZ90_65040 [Streptomyces albus subsp. albus]
MKAPSPQDDRLNRQGCMIGLFWIEQGKVCLGSPPVEEDPGVFLFPSRLSVGEGASQQAWPWADVTDLQVLDIPVRSTAARWTARLTSVVLTQWWQENQPSDVLHSHEREAVLEGWLAPMM